MIRLLARIMSAVCIGALLLPYVQDGLPASVVATPTDYVSFALLPVGIALGYLVAWRSEGLGSAITFASVVAYAVLDRTARIGEFPLGMLAFYAVPAVLFLLASFMARTSWASK